MLAQHATQRGAALSLVEPGRAARPTPRQVTLARIIHISRPLGCRLRCRLGRTARRFRRGRVGCHAPGAQGRGASALERAPAAAALVGFLGGGGGIVSGGGGGGGGLASVGGDGLVGDVQPSRRAQHPLAHPIAGRGDVGGRVGGSEPSDVRELTIGTLKG